MDYLSNKRTRDEASHTDTSDDEVIEIDTPITQSKLKSTDSSLDLGNDQIDYKPSTIPKHHQGYITKELLFKRFFSAILDENIQPVQRQFRLVQ